jgi:mRNA interferase HigB
MVKKTKQADWATLKDIKDTFNSVDYVGNDRYVFNIKGNKYRLVAMIFFDIRTLYLRYVDTHAEYDKIDCKTI